MEEAKQSIYLALVRRGLKPDEDFWFEPDNKVSFGGVLVDFALPQNEIAIDIVSIDSPRNQLAKSVLEGQNIQLVFIDESAALKEPAYVVGEALRGG